MDLKKKLLDYVIQNITETFLEYQKFMKVGEEDVEVQEEIVFLEYISFFIYCYSFKN